MKQDPAEFSENVAPINVFTGNMDDEVDCDLVDMTGSINLCSLTSISLEYSCLPNVCPVVNESVPALWHIGYS